jgi:hypothetical protein
LLPLLRSTSHQTILSVMPLFIQLVNVDEFIYFIGFVVLEKTKFIWFIDLYFYVCVLLGFLIMHELYAFTSPCLFVAELLFLAS